MGEAHVLAYENPLSSRYLVSCGSFTYIDMCAVLKKCLPPELADKVPDPEATKREEGFVLDGTHAKKVLGLQYIEFEKTIRDAGATLAKLWQETKAESK